MPLESKQMQVKALIKEYYILYLLTGNATVSMFYQITDLNKCYENQHKLISVETGRATEVATGNSWDF